MIKIPSLVLSGCLLSACGSKPIFHAGEKKHEKPAEEEEIVPPGSDATAIEAGALPTEEGRDGKDDEVEGNPATDPLAEPGAPEADAVGEITFRQSLQRDLNLFFVVDSSGSMESEIPEVSKNLGAFADDFQLTVGGQGINLFILGEVTLPAALPNVKVFDDMIGSHGGINDFVDFIKKDGRYEPYRSKRQQDIEVVFVTDDNAYDNGPEKLRTFLNDKKYSSFVSSLHVNGIIGVSTAQSPDAEWCKIYNVGTHYIDLAASAEFSGHIFDLCKTTSWKKTLKALSGAINKRYVRTEFSLSEVEGLMKVKAVYLNGEALGSDQWQYDGKTGKLEVSAAMVLKDEIKVEYEYGK